MDSTELFKSEKISKILFKLAPPVMLAQLIQALYNIVDSLFVGRFSDSGLTALSIVPFVWNVFVSLRKGQVAGDDPWGGNSLEWATSSPPPHHNFHHLPEVRSERPAFDRRHGPAFAGAGAATDPERDPDRG